ncbi:hypothetical protein QVD99_003522 [Batrachochytrium dendrobatidis]|nr:hypothetical protein QVD99_004183 [Batrachochytrium dendrobatidis]KAK5670033.1 hypothetical protein QVD99_003522 [Batrachochytrium dendrobatidis]
MKHVAKTKSTSKPEWSQNHSESHSHETKNSPMGELGKNANTKRRIPQWENWAKMQNASDRLHVQSTADKPGDISSLGGQSQIQQPADTMKQNGNIITQEFPLESIKT